MPDPEHGHGAYGLRRSGGGECFGHYRGKSGTGIAGGVKRAGGSLPQQGSRESGDGLCACGRKGCGKPGNRQRLAEKQQGRRESCRLQRLDGYRECEGL